jgi:hypothetical protein
VAGAHRTAQGGSSTARQTVLELWAAWRGQWTGSCRLGAEFIVMLISWELWKERNARCFRGAATQLQSLLATIRKLVELWVQAGAKNLGCLAQRVIT